MGHLWVAAPLIVLALILTHPETRLSLGVLLALFHLRFEKQQFHRSSMLPEK
jgi:hypothetical protein